MTALPQDPGLQRGLGTFAANGNRPGLTAKLGILDDQKSLHEDQKESFADLMRRLAAAHEREIQNGLEDLRKENDRLRASLHRGGPAESLQPLEGSPYPPVRRPLTPLTPTKPAPSNTDVDLASLVPARLCKEPPPPPVGPRPLLNVPLSKEEDEEFPGVKALSGMALLVHIGCASGLPNTPVGRDNIAIMPYCVVEVPGRPQEEVFRTDISPETRNPKWDYSEAVADFKDEDCLVFKVCSNGELLGHAKLDSSQLKDNFEGDLQLVHSGECDEDVLLSVRAGWCPPKGNSTHFSLRSLWNEDDSPRHNLSRRVHGSQGVQKYCGDEVYKEESVEVVPGVQQSGTFIDNFIAFPGSRPRLVWDITGAIFIVYDSLVIPLQVFNPPETLFGLFMDITILVYWTLNIPATLTVGFIKQGNLEMSPTAILINYLKTWFLVDLVVVAPDWYFSMRSLQHTSETASAAGESVRLLRMLRLIRTVRLVRLLKLRWIMIMINDLLASEYASILANIAKMIALLIIINHFIACLFFLIADMQVGNEPTWVTEHHLTIKDVGWGYQYLTSFHWSITQFTPASMHVQPQNALERSFAIYVVVFALVGFSYLVGSITNSMSQLRSMSEDASKQFWILRRYLKHHDVDRQLSTRIQRYIEHAWQKQKASVSEPKLFSLLSEQLSCELKCAQSLPNVRVHPLFAYMENHSYISMQRLACSAVKWRNLAQADTLFFPSEVATHLYFVVEGRLRYSKSNGAGGYFTEQVDRAEDWIAEPVLWTPCWVHLGTLIAETEADLVLIDGELFGNIIGRSPHISHLVGNYARMFMDWMNNLPFERLSDISQGEDVSDRLGEFIEAAKEKEDMLE